eukprot:jgi/Chrzof1/7531/Cz02g27090.t1_CITRX2
MGSSSKRLANGSMAGATVFDPTNTTSSSWIPSWLRGRSNNNDATTSTIKDITAADLETIFDAAHDIPLVIIFSANWCGPCKLLQEKIKAAAQDLGGPSAVCIVRIDVDHAGNREFATALQVQKLPTVMFVGPHDDQPAVRTQGLMSDAVIRDIIQHKCKHAGRDMVNAMRLV